MSDSTPANPGLFRRLWAGSEKVRTARYGLNAYGKLPIYKDFISTGLTEPAAREFRNWLDRGFSHRWSVDDRYRHAEIASHSFLFRLPDGKGCVAGSLWGSSDEGGLRRFPFTLFVSFPPGQAAADPLTAVEYLSLLDTRCQDLRDRFGPGASLASLYQAYRGAQFDCPLKSRTQIEREARSGGSSVALSEFAEAVLGAASASDWPGYVEEVAGAFASASDAAGAVRIPLGGALPRAREVEFWLLWMARHGRKGKAPVCGLLYPSGSGPGRATLFFRDLRPDDFFLLHPARTEGMDVRELPGLVAVTNAAEEVSPPAIAIQVKAAAVALQPEAKQAPIAEAPVAPEAVAPVDTSSVAAQEAAIEEVAASPGSASAAGAILEAPFAEAETPAPGEAPGQPQTEPPLLDTGGRPRLTQAPFELAALADTAPSEAPELPPAEPASEPVHTAAPELEAQAPSVVLPAIEMPPEDAPAPPAVAPVESPVPVAVMVTAPSGWDRPVFELLDA